MRIVIDLSPSEESREEVKSDKAFSDLFRKILVSSRPKVRPVDNSVAFRSRAEREGYELASLEYDLDTAIRAIEKLRGTEYAKEVLRSRPLPF